ncbi:hypothetical protein M413DRAFT_30252 [Hebeloma cylindrosporum]|uniref:Uncharacterized protein n=1 Tax=Hebeloma cylindrosporum TaxID=76867 RepID=A0A0C3BP34_HEBCY|nr:hypothetical protein M413DRAFT_30252 [Hebeloma cylindrosporum h7]
MDGNPSNVEDVRTHTGSPKLYIIPPKTITHNVEPNLVGSRTDHGFMHWDARKISTLKVPPPEDDPSTYPAPTDLVITRLFLLSSQRRSRAFIHDKSESLGLQRDHLNMETTAPPKKNEVPDLLTPALQVHQDLHKIQHIMEPIDETIGTEILGFVSEVQVKYDFLKVESRVFALTLNTHIRETLRGMVAHSQGDAHVDFNMLAKEMMAASTDCFQSFHQFADDAIESMMNLGAVIVAAEIDMETTLKSLQEGRNAVNTLLESPNGCETLELADASKPDLSQVLQDSINALSASSAKEVLELIENKVTFLLGKDGGETKDTDPLRHELSYLQERLICTAVILEQMLYDHQSFVKSVSIMMGKFGRFIETWDQVPFPNISCRSPYNS